MRRAVTVAWRCRYFKVIIGLGTTGATTAAAAGMAGMVRPAVLRLCSPTV